jgi:TolB-like protein
MAGEIFISYQRADAAWARLLHDTLKREGVEAWYDGLVGPGQEWRTATARALEASEIFVLLFSENAAQSSEIVKELAAATHEKKLVVPVRLQNIEPRGAFLYELASRNWINAYNDTEARLAELATGLVHLVRTGAHDESVLPLERGPEPVRKRTHRPAWLAAAAVVMAVSAAAFLLMHAGPKTSQPAPATLRVAVRLFQVLGDDPGLRQFAGGLQGEIVGELSDNQVPVDSSQDSLHTQGAGAAKTPAAYALDGTVERRGANFLVRAHLDDVRQAVTVWSSDFSGDAGAPEVLQKEIGALASIIGKAAVNFDTTAKGDSDAMGLYIKTNLYSVQEEAKWDDLRKLTEKFPQSSELQANFAMVSAGLAVSASPTRAAELQSIARTGAQRALALDPHDADAFFAQAFTFPSTGHWSERENILLEGLKAAPRSDLLTNMESNLLREVGRNRDAVAFGRQAQAQLPRSANRDATLILAFAATGNSFEGDRLAEAAAKFWPLNSGVWNARLQLAVFNARWDAALKLLAPGGYVPVPDAVAHAWRSALAAEESGGAAAKRAAARELTALLDPATAWAAPPPNERMSPGDAIGLVAMLGDKDGALALAATYLKGGTYADSSFLFWPNLQDLRRDPRFMALAAQTGLTDYWLASGKWPDFCGEPNWPYDCQKEAGAAKTAR